MSPQITHELSQIAFVVGIIVTALAGWASYCYGHRRAKEKDRIISQHLEDLKTHTPGINKKRELILRVSAAPNEKWTEIILGTVPGAVADYILMVFTSEKGRVSGKVRIKGSHEEYPFSSTANDSIPVVIRNLWVPETRHYKVPVVLEWIITEKTEADASLSMWTEGWLETHDRKPHVRIGPIQSEQTILDSSS